MRTKIAAVKRVIPSRLKKAYRHEGMRRATSIITISLFAFTGTWLLSHSRAANVAISVSTGTASTSVTAPATIATDTTAYGGKTLVFGTAQPATLTCNLQGSGLSTANNAYTVSFQTGIASTGISDTQNIIVKFYNDTISQPSSFITYTAATKSFSSLYSMRSSSYDVNARLVVSYDNATNNVHLSKACNQPLTVPGLTLDVTCTLYSQQLSFDIATQTIRFNLGLSQGNVPVQSVVINPGVGADHDLGSDISSYLDYSYDRGYSDTPATYPVTVSATVTLAAPYTGQQVHCTLPVNVQRANIVPWDFLPAGYYMDGVSQATSINGVTWWVNAYLNDLYNAGVAAGFSPIRTYAFTDPSDPQAQIWSKDRDASQSTLLNPSLPSHLTAYKATAQAWLSSISRIPIPLYSQVELDEVYFVYERTGAAGLSTCAGKYTGSNFYCTPQRAAGARYATLFATRDAAVNAPGDVNGNYLYYETTPVHEWTHIWQFQWWPEEPYGELPQWAAHNPPWFDGYSSAKTSEYCTDANGLASGDPGLRCYNYAITGFSRGYGASDPQEDIADLMGEIWSQAGWNDYQLHDRLYQVGGYAGSGDTYILDKLNDVLNRIRNQTGTLWYDYKIDDVNRSINYVPKP